MIEQIESKLEEVIQYILEKPKKSFTKNDFDILACEYARLKMKLDSDAQNKRLSKMMSSILSK